MQTAFREDITKWMAYVRSLTLELKKMIKNNEVITKDTVRLMITGSPMIWPTWKVLTEIEQSGATVVIDDSCAGSQYFYNPAEPSDWSMRSMIEAVSDKYLLPTICPIFIHSDDRTDRILELFEEYKVQGLVYHVLRLCQLIDFEYNKTAHVMREKKMPILKVETEFGEEDVEQIKTRVEAFIEMIKQ